MSDAERPPDEVRSEVSVQKGHAPPRAGVTRASHAQEEPSARDPAHLLARIRQWESAFKRRVPPWSSRALALLLIVFAILLPFFFTQTSGFLNATIISLAYVVMALGLNIVVGFA